MLNLKLIGSVLEQQIRFNDNKSLFYDRGKSALGPSPRTLCWLLEYRARMIKVLERIFADGLLNHFTNKLAEQGIRHFIQVNQFMQFTSKDKLELAGLYKDQFMRIWSLLKNEGAGEEVVQQFFHKHYQQLRTFLIQTNGEELFKKYTMDPHLFWVPCEQYSANLQVAWLGLDVEHLDPPVLDLGCGPKANLVRFLRGKKIEAYGMDREVEELENQPFLRRMGWMEASFEKDQWGTIISHLAFSNHFTHHHLKSDGEPEAYAQKYMELLMALKPGGSFFYAPSVPFIESFVDQLPQYFVRRTRVTGTQQMTQITRLY
ncbi:class I SAM-dependent methyltransferase [Paenibacillus pabuli]|uniref:class I SAM-dependent methyltransferase n=1 Tax=Paenibacillus pabuli TaxID=1472 RepID=UPI000783C855|nr:class I SAM-dependent methyltransferase [Paenibacillus pabuli]MEC0127426.1 class I SAM-dependent methyltransferase [Paenibacillus pabuli]